MGSSIFKKDFDSLTDDEKELVSMARHVLYNGDRLYGEDVEHVEYAVGLALSELLQITKEGETAITYVELGKDDSGLFVSFVKTD